MAELRIGEHPKASSRPSAPTCSEWARSLELDPIASVSGVRGVLLLEWPAPWPDDIWRLSALAPLREVLAAADIRLQLVRAPDARVSEDAFVALHRFGSGPDRGETTRQVGRTKLEDVPKTARRLVEDDRMSISDDDTSDLLICAHGSRDRCCGSAGTRLAVALHAHLRDEKVRVWRTSHLGGHRFAPTGMLLPEASVWAYLDVEVATSLVRRTTNASTVASKYRGCLQISDRRVQPLDRAAFIETGWSWLSSVRTGWHRDGERVALEGQEPDGRRLRWEGVVTARAGEIIPACGQPVDVSKSPSDHLELVAWRHVP